MPTLSIQDRTGRQLATAVFTKNALEDFIQAVTRNGSSFIRIDPIAQYINLVLPTLSAVTFDTTVYAAAVVTSIAPVSVPSGKPATIVVTGTGFVQGLSQIIWNAGGAGGGNDKDTPLQTTFVSATQLVAGYTPGKTGAIPVGVMNGANLSNIDKTITVT